MNKKKSQKLYNYSRIAMFISLVIFLVIISDYFCFGIFAKPDQIINQGLENLRTPVLTKIMIILTSLIDYPFIIILSVALSVALLLFRKKKYFALFIISILIGYFLEYLLKIIIHRPRPLNSLVIQSTFSLPSAHATISIIFFLMLLFSFIKDINSRFLKTIYAMICLSFPLIISFSRIYLGAHWLSDVLAGIALGCFVVFSIMCLFKKKHC
jgi:membrane-associated phospholipid phosphatase